MKKLIVLISFFSMAIADDLFDCAGQPYVPVSDSQEFVQIAESSSCIQYTLISDAYSIFSTSGITQGDFIYINTPELTTESRIYSIADGENFAQVRVLKDIYDLTSDCDLQSYMTIVPQTTITLMQIQNVYDFCGICGGDSSDCEDCAGIPNGDSYIDQCGVCDSDPLNDCVQDCDGQWGGGAEIDDCGLCTGGDTGFDYNEFVDCDGVCFGPVGPDSFGVCGGNDSIQGAIDAAESGAVINIPAGSYFESLEIDKPIDLQGNSDVTLYAAGYSIGITVSSSDVSISGLSVIGGDLTFAGIVVEPGSDNVKILSNSVSDIFYQVPQDDSPHGYGILVYGDSSPADPPTNVLIDGNTVLNILGAGISLGSMTENVTVSNNLVTNIAPAMINGQELSAGVIAQLANNVSVIGNTFSTVEIGTSLLQSIGVVSDNIYDDVSAFALVSTFEGSNEIFDVPVELDGYNYFNASIEFSYQALPVVIDGYFSSLEALNSASTFGDIVSATGYFTDGSSIDYTPDCSDQWGGSAELDTCGVCGGDNSSCDVLGDTNGDGQLDILDVVILINMVLADIYDPVTDMNDDGICNILDIVILVDVVLYSDAG